MDKREHSIFCLHMCNDEPRNKLGGMDIGIDYRGDQKKHISTVTYSQL